MKTKVWIALLALYIVWGSTYLAIRFSVETIPPFLHAALRFLISGAILYIWRRAAGDSLPTKSNWKATAIVGTLLLLGGNGLVALAEKNVPSGIAALVISTSPFWLVLFESLRAGGTKPNWQSLVGLVIGFGGVFLLIGRLRSQVRTTTQYVQRDPPVDRSVPVVLGSIYAAETCKIDIDVHGHANVNGLRGVVHC
jgi:drug/metabolite transporter (DMT)-like permease